MKVVIFVTHLLGTGHLARAVTLARAMHADGHDVCVVSGGLPAAHLLDATVTLVQLPPLRSDGVNFTRLLDANGAPATPEQMQQRRGDAIAVLDEVQPDAVITELFPFGRRVLTAEFTAILDAARKLRSAPVVCASIRDILAPSSRPSKAKATDALIQTRYDAVFVHSVAAITPLEASWPVTPAIEEKIHYTGFVAPARACPLKNTKDGGCVVVSAGGGSVGETLFATALETARQTPDLTWRFLVGGENANAHMERLRSAAPANVIVEPVRKDFRALLYHTKASVSMCGYNTALDILQAGTPAVFVPFDAGGETEQSLRAQTLRHMDGIEVLSSDALCRQKLETTVREVIAAPARAPIRDGMDGAAETSRLLTQLRSRSVP